MKICFFGAGYVGLVAAACFAESGNMVVAVDVDEGRIDTLKQGIIPIYEPGLKEMVVRNMAEGRLTFTTDSETAIQSSLVSFIAVGTPPGEDGSADLKLPICVSIWALTSQPCATGSALIRASATIFFFLDPVMVVHVFQRM